MVVKNLNQTNGLKKGGSNVVCRKCKSDQIVANKRGYSFGLMFKVWFIIIGICVGIGAVFGILSTVFGLDDLMVSVSLITILFVTLILSLPIALFCGAIGRNDIKNGCMNCGNKWVAGKAK